MDPRAAELIERFRLAPHPEGGYYREVYRSRDRVEPVDTRESRAALTTILFLLTEGTHSRWHRVASDEVWHFYGGDPIRLVLLHPDGATETVILGSDILAGQQVQVVVLAGTWQAGELVPGGEWALFGCTVAPGFTGTCFEGGRAEDLLPRYPERADDIRRLGIAGGHDTRMPSGFAT